MAEKPFWTSNKVPPDYERLMAEKTYNHLVQTRSQIEVELVGIQQDSEGGHERAMVHDSAGLLGHRNVLIGRANMIGDLSHVQLISPRQEVDKVFLGNKIRVWMDSDDSDDYYTVLGPDDASVKLPGLAPGTQVISYKSPLGASLIYLAHEDWGVFKNGNNLVAVRVLAIEPGEF